MDKVINRKGISLVALIITIIVLIILTAAVVVTGINTPRNTEYAIKMHNQSAVQDAVTLYIMTSMLDGMDNYDPSTAGSYTVKDVDDIVPELYNISSKQWTSNAATKLGINLTQEELQAVFILDSKGVVGWVAGQEPTLETDENNNQQPTCTITAASESVKAGQIATYTITFSENVTGLTSSEITVTNGQVETLTGSGKTYELTVVNGQVGTQTVTVPSGVCTDSANNTNTEGTKSIEIINPDPLYAYLYYMGETDTSSWTGAGNGYSNSATTGLYLRCNGTGSSSVGPYARFGYDGASLHGYDGIGMVATGSADSNCTINHGYAVGLVSVRGFQNSSSNYTYGGSGATRYVICSQAVTKSESSFKKFTIMDVSINYDCCVEFYATGWDYGGLTAYIKCAFIYKNDDRTALQTALALSDSQLDLFEGLDSSTWTSVLSNKNSVNYLLNNVSGDLMFESVGNSTIRGLITASTYATDFLNNEHWGKILTICQNNL